MRRIFIIMAACLIWMAISAQRVISSDKNVVKTKTLKTTDLGNQRLEAVISNDTSYVITLATGQGTRVVVALGVADSALHLLQFLADYEPSKGDIIDFENETGNVARWQGASGYLVYSEGRQFTGHLRKQNIKGFIRTIREFSGKESKEADTKETDNND